MRSSRAAKFFLWGEDPERWELLLEQREGKKDLWLDLVLVYDLTEKEALMMKNL